MNQQRKVIYKERQRVLAGADLKSEIQDFMRDTISGYVQSATVDPYEENWDLETLWGALQQLYPVSLTAEQIRVSSGGVLDPDTLTAHLIADAEQAYQAREDALGEEVMRELERRVVLSVLDTKWREHLYEMDYLQNGIGLRAMGQRDPLVEYQREGYDLFVAMMDAIKEETVTYVFAAQVQVTPAVDKVEVAAPGLATSRSIATTGTDLEYPDTPRNAACPCGSGKKYKRCHGDPRR